MFVGITDEDVLLAVELPAMVPLAVALGEGVNEAPRLEPWSKVTLIDVEELAEVEISEPFDPVKVVARMATVPLTLLVVE